MPTVYHLNKIREEKEIITFYTLANAWSQSLL